MRTHHDPTAGILTASCSREEFHLLQTANLPGDIQGAALLAELKRQEEDLHSRGFRVQVELRVEAAES